MKALSLAGIEPVRTSCGLFAVAASLHGEQPMTEMTIVRKRKTGGFFVAPLALNVKLRFTQVEGVSGEALELHETVRFPGIQIPWTSRVPLKQRTSSAFVLIDTDGDAVPDTFVPGMSNFDRPRRLRTKFDICKIMPQECACHNQGGEQHCVPL